MNSNQSCQDYIATEVNRNKRSLTVDLTRRGFLTTLSLGLVSWMATKSLAQVQVGGTPGGKVLVVLFLRGGADGLNMVIPYTDDHYHKARPNLRLGSPNDKSVSQARRVLDLDGKFGLHPGLAPLHDLYHEGKMAVVPACGSGDTSRSHFEAMATMERGNFRGGEGESSGWLGRLLTQHPGEHPSPLQSVAFGYTMPDALRGAPNALCLSSIRDFKFEADPTYISALRRTYKEGSDEISEAGRQTFAVLDQLNSLHLETTKPLNGAKYPDSDLGRSLREVATLIRSGVGLEYAYLDKGGWDTHVGQGAEIGLHALLLSDLSQSIRAFADDLGGDLSRTTLVVQTEFGRRVEENTGLGTDHGRASVAFVLGGGTKGGRIVGDWPGIAPGDLDEVGDLKVANDYRGVLAEVLTGGLGIGEHPFSSHLNPRLKLF